MEEIKSVLQVGNLHINYKIALFFSFEGNALSCGCDMAWVYSNSTYYDALTGLSMPTSDDGTKLSDVDSLQVAA